MADQKLTELTLLNLARVDDLVYIVTYEDEVAVSRGITVANFLASTVTGINRIISGQVVYTGVGYVFKTINLVYEINGIIYFSNDEDLTLTTPAGSNPRLDNIFVDANGIDVKDGTPAASPAVPSLVNPTEEISTNIVLVTNGTTVPDEITIETVYSENLQEVGGEWDTFESTSGTNIDLANTNNPVNLTTDIKAALPEAIDYILLDKSTSTNIADFQNLRMQFRSLGDWKKDYLKIGFYDGLNEVGYGFINGASFDTTATTTIFDVYLPTGSVVFDVGETTFDGIRYTWVDGGGLITTSAARFQLDLIKLELGGTSTKPEPNIITADKVIPDTSNFNNNLSSEDDTAQKAFTTIDNLITGLNSSFGESYINNYRSSVLDDGGTYFPNSAGYEYGKNKQLGLDRDMSLMMIPSGVKASILYSVKPFTTGQFTHARNSLETYIDEDGIIQTAAVNVPRIDYIDEDEALLLEPQSTNLIQRSESFDNAYWTKTGSSVVSGQSAPDGTNNAFKLIEDTATSTHFIRRTSFVMSNTDYSGSIFIKSAGSTFVHLTLTNGFTNVSINVNLDEGTIVAEGSSNVNSSIESLADDWYKISVTGENDGIIQGRYNLFLLNDSQAISYTGDGISGVYIFGSQLEEQSIKSSYIESDSGSTTTRLADVTNNAGDVNTFNSEEGVLYCSIKALVNDLSERYISLSDSTTANRVMIGYNTVSNQITALIDVGSANQDTLIYTVSDITEFSKVAFAWALNDFVLVIDGVVRDTGSSGSTFGVDVLTELNYDNGGGGNNAYLRNNDLRVYLTRLSNSVLIQLTT